MTLINSNSTITSDAELKQQENESSGFIYYFKSLAKNQYATVNDSVMGGRSISELNINQDAALFEGQVSLKNNGGFASVRTIWPFGRSQIITGSTLIVLKLRGDGKTYQFRLRTNKGMDGAAYSYSFKSLSNSIQTVHIPIDQFVPTFRGRTLSNMPELSFNNVQQMGFMIADKQTDAFKLELLSIELK